MRISKRRAKLLIINGSLGTPVEAFELRLMTTIITTTIMPTTTAPPCRPCAAHTRFGISIGSPSSIILLLSCSLCPTIPLPQQRRCRKANETFCCFCFAFYDPTWSSWHWKWVTNRRVNDDDACFASPPQVASNCLQCSCNRFVFATKSWIELFIYSTYLRCFIVVASALSCNMCCKCLGILF